MIEVATPNCPPLNLKFSIGDRDISNLIYYKKTFIENEAFISLDLSAHSSTTLTVFKVDFE